MRQALWPDSTAREVDDLLSARTAGEYSVLVVERLDRGLAAFAEVGIRAHAEGCASSPVAYLEGIWVDPDLRRSGVGSHLCHAVVAWARRKGLAELASDAALDNTISHAFHEAVGFVEAERLVCYRLSVLPASS